jgi:hypothetical protein
MWISTVCGNNCHPVCDPTGLADENHPSKGTAMNITMWLCEWAFIAIPVMLYGRHFNFGPSNDPVIIDHDKKGVQDLRIVAFGSDVQISHIQIAVKGEWKGPRFPKAIVVDCRSELSDFSDMNS